MEVYYPRVFGDSVREHLRALLPDGVHVHFGDELPDPARYQVLIAGRPSGEQLGASAELRMVIVPFAGIPQETRERLAEHPGLAVHNLHHNAAPTAELALALLLAAAKRVVWMDGLLRQLDWTPRYDLENVELLHARRLLVLGFGAIGQRVAAACTALGMEVQAVRRRALGDTETLPAGVEVFGMDALPGLLPAAHAVVVCAPLTPETRGCLGREELALLPRHAVVVNVGRAEIIDEEALYRELESGRLSAGLDVWYQYPEDEPARIGTAPSRFPFQELDNVVLSPHRGGHAREIELLRAQHLARLLRCAARGEPLPDRVDLNRGY